VSNISAARAMAGNSETSVEVIFCGVVSSFLPILDGVKDA
jgi:hypothetical protein